MVVRAAVLPRCTGGVGSSDVIHVGFWGVGTLVHIVAVKKTSHDAACPVESQEDVLGARAHHT